MIKWRSLSSLTPITSDSQAEPLLYRVGYSATRLITMTFQAAVTGHVSGCKQYLVSMLDFCKQDGNRSGFNPFVWIHVKTHAKSNVFSCMSESMDQ